VTEPDPPADLAAQLREEIGQLRGQLARAQGELGALRERFEAETSQTAMARLELKQMREELAEAIDKRKIKPPPAPWWLVEREQAEPMLAGLRGWFDGFLARHYPGYASRLPPCWWRHMEAVWELSALKTEWERIYADPENGDNQGLLNWHDRLLPGVLGRLADAIKCDVTGCTLSRRIA
jgi:regulator of replication initiation timing